MTADDRAQRLVALFVKQGLMDPTTPRNRELIERAIARAIRAAVGDELKAINAFIEGRLA